MADSTLENVDPACRTVGEDVQLMLRQAAAAPALWLTPLVTFAFRRVSYSRRVSSSFDTDRCASANSLCTSDGFRLSPLYGARLP
jgi:hypothetical protein